MRKSVKSLMELGSRESILQQLIGLGEGLHHSLAQLNQVEKIDVSPGPKDTWKTRWWVLNVVRCNFCLIVDERPDRAYRMFCYKWMSHVDIAFMSALFQHWLTEKHINSDSYFYRLRCVLPPLAIFPVTRFEVPSFKEIKADRSFTCKYIANGLRELGNIEQKKRRKRFDYQKVYRKFVNQLMEKLKKECLTELSGDLIEDVMGMYTVYEAESKRNQKKMRKAHLYSTKKEHF